MTTPWNAAADEAIAHNLADVFENGPRLAWGRKTAALAIDRRRKYVLLTGLGSLGVGTMWVRYDTEIDSYLDLPDDLPEEDSTGQFGAETPEELDRRYRRLRDAVVTGADDPDHH